MYSISPIALLLSVSLRAHHRDDDDDRKKAIANQLYLIQEWKKEDR